VIPKLELLKSKVLTEFPSGSSINYRDGKLYLIGDDARNILVLDTNYQQIDSIQLLDYPEKRIPKPEKPDLEGSTFATIRDSVLFLVVGSASTKKREKLFVIPVVESGLDVSHHQVFDTSNLVARLKGGDIQEVNLEGITEVGDHLVLTNRGNRTNPTNYLVVTDLGFWENKKDVPPRVLSIQIPDTADIVPGISDLCYVADTDTLWIVLSSEMTDNAYDDGTIGDSYLGWINDFASRVQDSSLKVGQLINLGQVHPDLRTQKIEGICVESVKEDSCILHFVSDNDQGTTGLFKVKMNYA
jgi:hypothetical protein